MKRLALLALLALSLPGQARAVTAEDFLDRMNADERNGFMNGALDMLAYELAEEGRGDTAACIVKWYFEGDGPREVAAVFPNHKDLPAVAILRTLAKRHCE